MGGKTNEREVSLNSGRTVCDHLDTTRYEAVPIFQTFAGDLYILPWRFLHRGKTTDFEHRLDVEAQAIKWDDLKNIIDFIYIATHGRFAEDGTLQGMLELLGIPYLGSKVFTSALGMDKMMQKKILSAQGIAVPRGIVLSPKMIQDFYVHEKLIVNQLSDAGIKPPFVVKPIREGSSFGVSIIDTWQELPSALHAACTIYPGKQQAVLVEEKIIGMEFSFIAITDYTTGQWLPLPPTEVVPEAHLKLYDYEQKYMPGRGLKITPARCTQIQLQKIQDVCLRASEVLGITNITRIDGFLCADDEVVIIDPNTLSGMAPAGFLFTQAAELNMSHTDLTNHLIETELHQYGMLSAIIDQEQKDESSMETKKIRIAVLLGGSSNEKEISLDSGRNVVYKLSPQKYAVTPIFVSEKNELFAIDQRLLVRNSTKEIAMALEPAMKVSWHDLPNIADFVFIGLHGAPGENGVVQGALEMLGLPYNGSSVLASALCMNKFKTTEFLKHEGFDVPQGMLVDKNNWTTNSADVIKKLNEFFNKQFPLIIKPHDDGCSFMVHKVTTEMQLQVALQEVFASGKMHALVEECVTGMELTVGVVGNDTARALTPSQAVATKGILSIQEKFLPGAGENQTPAPLPASALELVQRTVEQAYERLTCKGYARIDCFYQTAHESKTGKERVVLLEVNTLPGMTPATCIFHQAAEVGMKPMDFVDLIVTLGFEEHTKNLPLSVDKKCTTHVALSESIEILDR